MGDNFNNRSGCTVLTHSHREDHGFPCLVVEGPYKHDCETGLSGCIRIRYRIPSGTDEVASQAGILPRSY